MSLKGLVRIYRDTAGKLCAVERGTGKVYSLTTDKEVGTTGDYPLNFVGKFVVEPEDEAA